MPAVSPPVLPEVLPAVQEVFVYYKVAEADVGAVRAAADALQQALRADHPGLQARLLRRPGSSDGLVTVMELYAHAATPTHPGGVDADLRAAIDERAQALRPWLKTPRHTEVFQACA